MSGADEQARLDAESLLRNFISAEDPASAEPCLDKLISEHALPLIREKTRLKLKSGSIYVREGELQDEEDICQEVLFQLLCRLRKLRESGDLSAITNFRGYVATSTQNAYYGYLRMKYPVRSQLKNRIRYLMNNRPPFATWENSSGEFLCGRKEWRNKPPESAIDHRQVDLSDFAHRSDANTNNTHGVSVELIASLLSRIGGPIPLDELVGIVAGVLGICDPREVDLGEEQEVAVCELLPDPSPDAASQLEQRLDLERLWKEICLLPSKQRAALLLNLRDSRECDALILFTMTGITNLRQIAEVVDFPLDAFLELWNRLPLDDNSIAEYMGVTRQQVINLRKSARERLARRLATGIKKRETGGVI